jgi:uncharacterized delta-60 repeat protein
VRAVAMDADGKILIAGDFTTVDGATRNGIARLKDDGTLDTGFLNELDGADGAVNALAVQADGKILIGGDFEYVNNTERNRIARLDDDGSLDTSFDPGDGADDVVRSIAVQSDDKVIIGGNFTQVSSATRNRIARLNDDGSLDGDFNPNVSGGTAPIVHSVVVQQDGKIVIGGKFQRVGGVAGYDRYHVARLKTDGTVDTGDTGFDPGNAVGGTDPVVYSVVVESEGKVVIAGQFTTLTTVKIDGDDVEVINSKHVTRLGPNGSLDGSFRPGPYLENQAAWQYGPDNVVRSVAIQADGLIVVGGDFDAYSVPGSSQSLSADSRIARIGGL